ncbi:MAG: WYL domain-containing protein, partial [Ethanoligenens sp.]
TQFIRRHRMVEFQYQRQNQTVKHYTVKPVGLVFSEFYFYLVGYIKGLDKPYPAIFRLDKIDAISPLKETFDIPYSSRFEEGAFKNRIQFMYAGEVVKITFRFWGLSLEAVLDRLPTARIIEQHEKEAIVEANIYGKGIKMWFLSQMDYLEVLSPASLRTEMAQTIRNMLAIYERTEG